MTDAERIERVKSFFDRDMPTSPTTEEASSYLAIAKGTVLNRLYAFNKSRVEGEELTVPERYEGEWCELAARYFSRKGGLGETMHIENGIHRDWYSSDDRDLLARIIPYAAVR